MKIVEDFGHIREELLQFTEVRRGRVYVAWKEENVVGNAVVELEDDEAVLNYLHVYEEYRNLAIGSALVKRIVEDNPRIRAISYRDATITHPNTQRIYRKLGFKLVGETYAIQLWLHDGKSP